MSDWKPGDRVEHASYGVGTVLVFGEQHAVIRFDLHGQRTFASHLVVLTESSRVQSPRMPRGMRSASERATDVGHENLNEQTVVRATNLEGNQPGEKVYVLSCARCGAQYGAHGCDIQLRRCPVCMGGPPGLAV